MKMALVIFLLLKVNLAFTATLTIAVVPPGPGIYPDMRKAVGHVVPIIHCGSITRRTSISTTLFHGPVMESEIGLRNFLHRYRHSSRYFVFPIDEKSCQNLLVFDDFYRDFPGITFSPFLDPLREYENFLKGMPSVPGGTGASYAVAFLKLINAKIPFAACKESFFGHKIETARSVMKCLPKSSAVQIP